MSWFRLTFICCDECATEYDHADKTVDSTRRSASRHGWTFVPSRELFVPGLDLCPDCSRQDITDGFAS